jgi:hypothetical protein
LGKEGADHMIDFAKQSLSEPKSRTGELKNVEDWSEERSSRLEKGEDPCLVYQDIQRTATTF